MYKAIIFDMDMTLIDSKSVGYSSFNELNSIYGLDISKISDQDMWRYTHVELMEKVAEQNNDEYPWEQISQWNRTSMHKHYADAEILYIDVLMKLKEKGIHMSLVSSANIDVINLVLENPNNARLKFSEVYGSEYGKSKVDFIKQIIESNGFKPEEVMYVGDHEKDMVAAKKAGVIAVGITTGFYFRPRLIEAGADIVIDNLGELVNYFEEKR